MFQAVSICKYGRARFFVLHVVLWLSSSNELAWVSYELNVRLHNQGVVEDHAHVVALDEGLRHVVAGVVDSSCTYVATGFFECIRCLWHTIPVFTFQGVCKLRHACCNCHLFEMFKQFIKQFFIVAKLPSGRLLIDQLRYVEVIKVDGAGMLENWLILFLFLWPIVHLDLVKCYIKYDYFTLNY